jgi:spore coat protein CotH
MTVVALIFEGDTASLVEPLAYEVYRRAGMPVEQSHFVRLWQDGKLNGYTLLIEQPNRAFLRRNRIDDGGNMYKLLWFGGDLIGQHEKHTNRRLGHEDLTNVVAGLDSHKGADQWDYIQKQFDVDEVATYFAVNMVLSHWDGFFNNYFTYHDSNGTGKWMMFPWDQDSTWGSRGSDDGGVFYNMALTFGMAGDTPPQEGGGSWRPPGWFSGPLLANPQFRKIFLARTKQLLQSVYTEAVFGPVLDQYEATLLPEVKLRAEAQKQDPAAAVEQLRTDIARCREHIRKRREFLLAQAELKQAVGDFRPVKSSSN